MSYDLWKLTDPSDVETEPRWDDEETSVDECVHGEHPLECSLCTSAGFIAAVSGEGEDMSEEQDGEEMIIKWLDEARPSQLRRISYHIDNVIERRKTELAREAKELEAFDKPVRKTRRKPEAA
jgi:hypothetical protein